ncbi:SanA/YdcF family protein [Demequina aurantiaca]|uniref:SanA/YdcF family protein n=1 Tax=Demequina aurantiaca TaxID=676200 RepID=UPI003D34F8D3
MKPRGSDLRGLAGFASIAMAPLVVTRAATLGWLHPVASAALQPADAALVLGARVWEDGRPSRFLRERVQAGVTLYERGLVPKIVMSGAQSNREGLDEVESMVRTAIELGVPESDIVRDGVGVNTRASAVNACRVLGLRSVIVCTQEFHLPRAVWLCQLQGLTASGVFPPVQPREHTLKGYIREVPATWKAMLIEGVAVAAKLTAPYR